MSTPSQQVSAVDLSSVEVIVTTLAGRTASGALVELTTGGAEVRLDRDDAAIFGIGHIVRLRLAGPLIKESVETSVRVQYLVDDDEAGQTRCGLHLLEPARFEQSLQDSLRGRLNRRKMSRVKPDASDPIWVRLSSSVGVSIEKARGDLADISGIGVGVLLEAHSVGPFDEVDLVELSFKLPTWGAELHLVGRIRYRLRLAERFRFGIEFDPGRTEGFDRQQGLILQFVRQCQRAQIEEPSPE